MFLTKPELFLFAARGSRLWTLEVPAGLEKRTTISLVWVSFMLLPPLLAVVGFSRVMPWMVAVQAALTGWSSAFNFKVAGLHFYRAGMGTEDIPASIALLAGTAAGYAILFGVAALVAVRPGRRFRWVPATPVAVLVGMLAWPYFARPLPLAILALTAAWRKTLSPARAAMLAFSLLLLGKIVLNVRVWHYGFVLALPATMLLIVLLVSVVPTVMVRRGIDGAFLRQTSTLFLVGIMVVPVVVSVRNWQLDPLPVGVGRDQFLADERGRIVQAAVDAVSAMVRPDQTLLVMPEGVMINYLARRRNPTPYINFMPPELVMFGEAENCQRVGGTSTRFHCGGGQGHRE